MSSGIQSVAHGRVALERADSLIGAVIVLEVVHSPTSPGLCIDSLMSQASWIMSGASTATSIRVESKEKPAGVNVVDEALQGLSFAGRELGFIRLKSSILVSRISGPAVVEVLRRAD